jgi:serine phosphatase RsbU (regulator of sigma subunit)
VPILGRDSRLVGLLVLGARLSEEPYSRDDRLLLTSIASQTGIALESIRLGENIAERIETERHLAQEMEYAKQVQARLFPQKMPAMETLEYAGGCIQARQVGGDYYDFLELRPGRLALVLADIAGKGIPGALLMANLQANLRGQYAVALEDLPRLLKSVNQLFFENSSESSYATLFFADYDDSTRRLRYVNCGHLPPLLLRADGRVERLTSTNTLLGLFEKWECAVAEVQFTPDDILVLYTDGVTEAENAQEEQFGESRLAETILAHRQLQVASLLETIVATVLKFSDGEQADDITLAVARCKP